MGKRRRKEESPDEMRRKIRRLEKRLDRYEQNSQDSCSADYESDCSGTYNSMSEQDLISDEDLSEVDRHSSPRARSEPPARHESPAGTDVGEIDPLPSTSASTAPATMELPALPQEILDALGESKEKDEIFGPKIREEVSKRWGKIVMEGLSKEQRQILLEGTLIPENFQLLKAPKLNPEIAAVLTESSRNRDKCLEKAQSQLGVGIASVTSLMTLLIDGNVEKAAIIKKISETGQILLDLHCQETINRRKLACYSLDKKFLNIIQDIKRDSFLFGENLGDKIKASKTAEKSGLQVKRTEQTSSSSAYRGNRRRNNYSGNYKGPPRQQNTRARGSGHRARGALSYKRQTDRTLDRVDSVPKSSARSNRKT